MTYTEARARAIEIAVGNEQEAIVMIGPVDMTGHREYYAVLMQHVPACIDAGWQRYVNDGTD